MSISDQKEDLRKELLKRREGIAQKEYQTKSDKIIHQLKRQPEFRKSETVHCYVSMNQRGEVDTHSLLNAMIARGLHVVVPITDMDSYSLKNVYLEDIRDLKSNKWGVLEPSGGKEVPADLLDLVVVPVVGGDMDKNRIGYGKGFYDRFLKKVNCAKIGLLFEVCLLEQVPIEAFDIPLDKLITEDRVIS